MFGMNHSNKDAVTGENAPMQQRKADGTDENAPVQQRKADGKTRKSLAVLSAMVGVTMGLVINVLVMAANPTVQNYRERVEFYRDHFFAGTTVNGIDISDRTPEEAKDYLQEVLADYRMDILTREGTHLTLTGKEIGMTAEVKMDLNDLLSRQNPWNFRKGAKKPAETRVSFSYDHEKLRKWYENSAYFTLPGRVKNQEAFLTFEDGKYVYHKQIQGTRIYRETMFKELETAVSMHRKSLDLNDTDGYMDPLLPVMSEMEAQRIASNIADINRRLAAEITYDLGDGITETVDKELLKKVYSLDENYEIVMDPKPLEEFLIEKAGLYNTLYQNRTFVTHNGTVRSLGTGTYGWKLDFDASLNDLIAMVQEGEARKDADFIYEQRAVSHVPDHDFGNTYVEVDMDEQHVYIWQNGQCVHDMACVTGTASKPERHTWEGVWYVAVMEKNHIMRGTRDANGVPEYEIPCVYWMNFIPSVGIGLHDLNRSAYGGQIYWYNGSHGCVNLPMSDAALLYEQYCYIGLPVITYGGYEAW